MSLLQATLERIGPTDRALVEATQKRLDNKTKPIGSLGRLEEIACRLAAIRGEQDPVCTNKTIVTMAGDHGVAAEGISLFPSEVTMQMVHNFVAGGAGVNVLARHVGAEVVVVDLGVAGDLSGLEGVRHEKVGPGTGNIARGPAMEREQAIACLEAGIRVVDDLVATDGLQLLGTGDMGIGNTTPSAAIVSTFTGLEPGQVTGRGTGIGDDALQRKVDLIRRALEINRPDPADPVDVLAKVGGFEIGGLGGLVLGAAANRIPVVVDGFIASAGALVACELCPAAKEYVFASHRSVEVGHRALLARIGQEPLLDLAFRLGEGTGAALAMGLVDAAAKILTEMASFEEAGVSKGE